MCPVHLPFPLLTLSIDELAASKFGEPFPGQVHKPEEKRWFYSQPPSDAFCGSLRNGDSGDASYAVQLELSFQSLHAFVVWNFHFLYWN